MALTTLANWREYTGVDISEAPDALITNLINRASGAIENYCDRTFASTAYRERYDGDSSTTLYLRQWPVTAVTLVSTSIVAPVRITNTSSDAFRAYISVGETGDLSTSLTLTIQGGTNDGSDTLAFAARGTYTLATLVTAINALGKSWTATLDISTEQYWDAVEILPVMGYECLNEDVYLSVPYDPCEGYKVSANRGEIYLPGGFYSGVQNVLVRYTAGYATIPTDLEQICIDLVQLYYKSRTVDTSVKAERLDDHAITYADDGGGGARDIPRHLRRRLASYKRWRLSP